MPLLIAKATGLLPHRTLSCWLCFTLTQGLIGLYCVPRYLLSSPKVLSYLIDTAGRRKNYSWSWRPHQ